MKDEDIDRLLQRQPATPDERLLASIRVNIAHSLKQVKPLPSDRTLTLLASGFFVVFSILATIPVRFLAWHVLMPYQAAAYYGLLLVLAVFFAAGITQYMVPGARRRVHPIALIVGEVLAIAALVPLLFGNSTLDRFLHFGEPCLRTGLVASFLFGTIACALLRKGYFVNPRTGSAFIGFFAGLAGFTVLALHCPILNSAHILVWHLGSLLAGGFAGTLAGRIVWR